MGVWYMYLVLCKDGTYYTGISQDVEARFVCHKSKRGAFYTKGRGVEKILYKEKYDNIDDARKREIQVKDWSRKKKEKLINGEWNKQNN